MVAMPVAGGLTPSFRLPNPPSFARPSGHLQGNDLPAQTGPSFDAYRMQPGPGPGSGGQAGSNDGAWGASPDQPKLPAQPRVAFDGPEQCTAWRGGIQGWNDKLTAKDRHAYWDQGHQRQGTDFTAASSPPNTYNNPMQEPPLPELRTINRTVSYQQGTDTTRNQDDLARGYTWLGEQGSGWAPVYGGVPGLYLPYGSRGGVPYAFVSPVQEGQPGDGPHKVFAGPPHGLHSLTFPDRGDTLNRYQVNPQMRPVRIDRPSNSPQAGQSYNQTVLPQGGTPRPGQQANAQGWTSKISGRGWLGTPQ